MKRKKAWKRGLLGVAAVLAVYLFMTPMGALRLGVALSGHPKEAICLPCPDGGGIRIPRRHRAPVHPLLHRRICALL